MTVLTLVVDFQVSVVAVFLVDVPRFKRTAVATRRQVILALRGLATRCDVILEVLVSVGPLGDENARVLIYDAVLLFVAPAGWRAQKAGTRALRRDPRQSRWPIVVTRRNDLEGQRKQRCSIAVTSTDNNRMCPD